jgi:hypothetical protein
LYEESLYINVPGLVLEPKEKGGEVTLQRDLQLCITIDVGKGNTVTINNTRMLLRGSDAPKAKKKDDKKRNQSPSFESKSKNNVS